MGRTATTSKGGSDTRIDTRNQKFGNDAANHIEHGGDQDGAENNGKVALQNGIVGQATNAGSQKNDFDNDGVRQ
jgi:hypothetical protein